MIVKSTMHKCKQEVMLDRQVIDGRFDRFQLETTGKQTNQIRDIETWTVSFEFFF